MSQSCQKLIKNFTRWPRLDAPDYKIQCKPLFPIPLSVAIFTCKFGQVLKVGIYVKYLNDEVNFFLCDTKKTWNY